MGLQKKTEEVGVFISKWGTEAKMVKLLISKGKQSSLYEYQNVHQINGKLINE